MITIKPIRTFLIFTLACVVIAVGGTQVSSYSIAPSPGTVSASEVVLKSDIQWSPLNPARGDQSPKAGKLWGDRTDSGPSGFLVDFVDGFSSPPHIHNVTYRGMVISGLIHNDDPSAKAMWMPAGSFWTQPAGEAHITAAEGHHNLAYIEIEEGPYLVRSTEEAFDNGERPVNVDQANIVWLDASNIAWIDQPGITASNKGPKVAFLWGDPQDDQPNGTLLKLPTRFTGMIRTHGSTFRAVVIRGATKYWRAGETEAKTLESGSYFGSQEESAHQVSCEAGEDCIIYVRSEGKFEVNAEQAKH